MSHSTEIAEMSMRRGANLLKPDERSLVGAHLVYATPLSLVGAAALGALAVGAVAVGAFAIGRLSVGRARIRSLKIDELEVGTVRGFRAPDPLRRKS